VGFMVDNVALEYVFSEYVGFPCQFSFHRLLHIHHHLSSGAGTSLVDVSGRLTTWTQSQPHPEGGSMVPALGFASEDVHLARMITGSVCINV
jgi:hypothetical protein